MFQWHSKMNNSLTSKKYARHDVIISISVGFEIFFSSKNLEVCMCVCVGGGMFALLNHFKKIQNLKYSRKERLSSSTTPLIQKVLDVQRISQTQNKTVQLYIRIW